ncbi:MAG: DUF4326 domain-containing protein [Acidimicrobiales bacterium]|nr:DUF4326 domain-containing protein [Acidimicrobiales bacterium]
MPERIQLRRAAGWRKPPDAIVVARPTRWGNPHPVANGDRAHAVELYRRHLAEHPELAAAIRQHLAGHDLACWCPLTEPCHADLLLAVANDHTDDEVVS